MIDDVIAEVARLQHENENHVKQRIIDAKRIHTLKSQVDLGLKERAILDTIIEYERAKSRPPE